MHMVKILKIDLSSPNKERVKEIAAVILSGQLVAIPTDTLYGIAANSLDEGAIKRIYQIKKRDLAKPILLFIHNKEQLTRIVSTIPETGERLIRNFWPGPLTLIFEAAKDLPLSLPNNTSKIALRQPNNLFLELLLKETKVPLTGTSANISGGPTLKSVKEIETHLGEGIDLIVDGGLCETDKASSIVDINTLPPTLIREGQISRLALEEVLGEQLA
jgi:L-threonylcarbamoyladenylate synthase